MRIGLNGEVRWGEVSYVVWRAFNYIIEKYILSRRVESEYTFLNMQIIVTVKAYFLKTLDYAILNHSYN